MSRSAVDSGLFGFWHRFGSVTGFFKPAPSPKPRQNPKILAAHRYIFSVNALAVMKRTIVCVRRVGAFLLFGLVAINRASAATSQTLIAPYHGIAVRNVFDLRAPVGVANAPLVDSIALPKITLIGITTIFGRTIAFITIAGNKPGQPPESVMLAEGQALHEIEVKAIDYKSGIIQVVNHGQTQTLDFDGDPDPLIIHKCPSFRPSQPMPRSEAPLTPEEQVALIEIQREKFRQENNPVGNLLPPTEMTSESTGNGP